MSIRMIAISWKESSEEGSCSFSVHFKSSHKTLKLDLLSDAIHDLTKEYNRILKEENYE